MIAYKVIHEKTRYGSNAAIYQENNNKSIECLLKKYPKLTKYFPIYEKGKEISFVSGSIGLMCFKLKDDAKTFMYLGHRSNTYNFNIIKIKYDKIDILPTSSIIVGCGSDPLNLLQSVATPVAPAKGTIFLRKLLVLE